MGDRESVAGADDQESVAGAALDQGTATGADDVVVDVPDGLLVLSLAAGRLVAACGVTHGPAIARPVRAAGPVIAAGGRLDLEQVLGARGDLAAVTAVLRNAARATA